MSKDLLVKCPEADGVCYFLWVCRQRQRDGWTPCVACDAPDRAVGLREIVIDADGR
jgi:hypothetical protein